MSVSIHFIPIIGIYERLASFMGVNSSDKCTIHLLLQELATCRSYTHSHQQRTHKHT